MRLAAAALAVVAACARPSPAPECGMTQSLDARIPIRFPSGGAVTVEVATDGEQREIGLMCRTSLASDAGMLFAFDRELPLQFWMKNTLIPLDIVWIGADKRVTGISPRLKESTTATPEPEVARAGGRAQWVLELAAGETERRGVMVGDKLQFDAPKGLP